MFITINMVKSQNRNFNWYSGIYTGGYVETITALAPPRYKEINFYNITLTPRLGYIVKQKVTLGVTGLYSFAKSNIGNAPSTFGGGYFVKYNFNRVIDTSKKKIQLIWFFEFQHLFYDGYYTRDALLVPRKVSKPMNEPSFHVGVDFVYKKQLMLGVSYGISQMKFYNNNEQPNLGERKELRPYGRILFQYLFN